MWDVLSLTECTLICWLILEILKENVMHFVKLLHLSMSLELLHFQYPLTVVVRMEEHLILIKMVVVNAIVQTIQWEIPVKQVKGYFFLTKYNFHFIYNQLSNYFMVWFFSLPEQRTRKVDIPQQTLECFHVNWAPQIFHQKKSDQVIQAQPGSIWPVCDIHSGW